MLDDYADICIIVAMKDVIWMGDSRDVWTTFPKEIQDDGGFQLHRVQSGLDPSDWKPMTTIGTGVRELRFKDANGIYRLVYLATRPEGVYVLHVFQKKTQATSLPDIRKAQARLAEIKR